MRGAGRGLRTLGGLAVAALLAGSGPAAAHDHETPRAGAEIPEVQVAREIERYDVSGESVRDLRVSLGESGPADASGRRRDARTDWEIGWSLELDETFPGCRIGTFRPAVEITTTLPRWAGKEEAKHRLKREWERYVRALERHEEGHAEIAVRTAEAIRAGVAKLGERPTCDQLHVEIRSIATAALEAAREEHADYDRRTEHGRTQGASFP